MADDLKAWTVAYTVRGMQFTMHVVATKEEVDTHVDNLGCDSADVLVGVIPYEGVLVKDGEEFTAVGTLN